MEQKQIKVDEVSDKVEDEIKQACFGNGGRKGSWKCHSTINRKLKARLKETEVSKEAFSELEKELI